MIMASDLGKLEEGINSMVAVVGDSVETGESATVSVWESIVSMKKVIRTLPYSVQRSLQTMQTKIQAMQTEVKDLGGLVVALPTDAEFEVMEDRMSQVESQMQRYDAKFAQVLGFCRRLQSGRSMPAVGPQVSVDNLQDQIDALRQELQSVTANHRQCSANW